MKRFLIILVVFLFVGAVGLVAFPGLFSSGGPSRQRVMLVEQYDEDHDGQLSDEERGRARQHVTDNPVRRGPPGGPGGGGRRGGRRRSGPEPQPGEKVSVDQVAVYPDADLYDEKILRTWFLEFQSDDWERELADFYRTDVEVPATLIVDGKQYSDVGVKFRGNSSFFTVSEGQKRSFNIRLDANTTGQSLYGYQTLNLLNAHTDPSFLREVLYNHIARTVAPAPKANFVKLVINGESWGIYVNVQQFNKEFTKEWFDRTGERWKAPAGPGQGHSLTYNGKDVGEYSAYELKRGDPDEALQHLIELCKTLNSMPIEQLDEKLDPVLAVDRALWFLALDNVLIDTDGYYARGTDYLLFRDPKFERYHVLTYDSNETFRTPGDGGPGGPGGPGFSLDHVWRFLEGDGPPDRGGRGGRGPDRGEGPDAQRGGDSLELHPLAGHDREEFPLLNRLLANDRLRARYLAHVKSLRDQWLRWERIGPVIEGYRNLIDDEIRRDTRKLVHYEDFAESLERGQSRGRRPAPGLKPFVQQRAEYLDGIEELAQPTPEITKVTVGETSDFENATPRQSVTVQAVLAKPNDQVEVRLYYATSTGAPFRWMPMKSQDAGGFAAEIPSQIAGTRVRFYVEAYDQENQTANYYPPTTEVGALSYHVLPEIATSTPLRISEVMASNQDAWTDPQGEREDWIEIANRTDAPVDLSGMYLSDQRSAPRKWKIPAGTTIAAGGHLVVWADNDTDAAEGLHANFKLSKGGERLTLADTDAKHNQLLDIFLYPPLEPNATAGRIDLETDEIVILSNPTPGRSNE